MTPREKAEEILEAMMKDFQYCFKKDISKKHALIAIDEIILFLLQASEYLQFPQQIKYWQDVKREIVNN